jgi:hypothetical protein
MGSSFSTLEFLHRLSANHREAVIASAKCGCFYCERTFEPSAILDWVDNGTCALCPHCGIDSVIPETPACKLTPEVLHDMNAYWFKRSVFVLTGRPLLQKLILKAEPLKRRISWLFRGGNGA